VKSLDKFDEVSIVTNNVRGRTTTRLNEINERFVELARTARQPVLDLGCAFGVAALAALETGAQVIANDIDPCHLAAVRAAAPEAARVRLETKLGAFPWDLQFPPDSLKLVHASNLLNFLRGHEIDEGFRRVGSWLVSGGRFLSISGTPFARNIAAFVPIYKSNRAADVEWPGECPDLTVISDHPTIKELPRFLHLLDPEVLSRSAQRAGLVVEEAYFFHRRDTPSYIELDGRENVVLVARKV
jgi:SAM-dependent methyltransferase